MLEVWSEFSIHIFLSLWSNESSKRRKRKTRNYFMFHRIESAKISTKPPLNLGSGSSDRRHKQLEKENQQTTSNDIEKPSHISPSRTLELHLPVQFVGESGWSEQRNNLSSLFAVCLWYMNMWVEIRNWNNLVNISLFYCEFELKMKINYLLLWLVSLLLRRLMLSFCDYTNKKKCYNWTLYTSSYIVVRSLSKKIIESTVSSCFSIVDANYIHSNWA